jgi:hypothetical protein
MTLNDIAQLTSDVLSAVLIVKLLSLRLHSVYRIFCYFLVFDLFASLISFTEAYIHNPRLDYRITWICLRVVAWILSLSMVYALLNAVLVTFPGVLRLSRRLLNVTLIAVGVLALVTANLDSSISGSSGFLSNFVDPIGKAVRATLDVERAICSVALLMLVVVLTFILWFPVPLPRNLAMFSFGFVVYFAAKTGLLLTRGWWSRESFRVVSDTVPFILAGCYACLIMFITQRGETTPVKLGHSWQSQDQDRLLAQLESMNAALLRGARR